MSYLSVQLTRAVTAVAVAVLVGGSTAEHPQPEEPVSQPQTVKIEQPPMTEASPQSVSVLDAQRSKCSAPSNGEGISQLLARLVKGIQPNITNGELWSLTSDPEGVLVKDLRTHMQLNDASSLNVADTVCVVRAANSVGDARTPGNTTNVVWFTHMPGFEASPTAYR